MGISNLRGLMAGVALLATVAGGASAGDRPAAKHPNLSGLWTSTSLTELQRPAGLSSLTLSDAEATAYAGRHLAEMHTERDNVGGRGSEVDYWSLGDRLARIGGQARTSWIVEPADGRLPYSPGGLAARAREVAAHGNSDNPESRNVSEQCLVAGWAAAGPPMINSPYGDEYQIVQTGDAVAIVMETIHDVRIVRLIPRPPGGDAADPGRHLPPSVRPWMGDSVGWWDGATLVVETTNFNPGDALKMPTDLYISASARVVERFSRSGPGDLLYEFTVEDPATFTRTWRAQMAFQRSKGPMFEYACHEGNYSLPGILAGARHEEAQAH
jgi:hypothetical protein